MPVNYPPVGFHFRVEFNLSEADSDHRFQEVSGLSAEMNTEELREGGLNEYTHRLPTLVKYSNLVLKRGLLKDSAVYDWISEAIHNFEFEPTNVVVTLLNESHEPLVSWSFEGAYPLKWSVSEFRAMENGYVVETLELAFRKFKRN
jgi:phage tail-like protein